MKKEESNYTLSLEKQAFYLRWLGKIPQFILLGLIYFYIKLVSPVLPSSCRYYPTCSAYALTSIKRYGPFKGTFLAAKRVARCHPFHPGGYDPVP